MLVRVVAPHFVSGIVLEQLPSGGDMRWFCTRSAPILGWCLGRGDVYLRGEFRRLGWVASVVGN
jgi:hypothetical protein